MRLGIRLLFGFFLVTGLAAFFVLRVFVAEVKPSVREVMEDMLVDSANILAEIASDDLAANRIANGRFAEQVRGYAIRPIDAQIWGCPSSRWTSGSTSPTRRARCCLTR